MEKRADLQEVLAAIGASLKEKGQAVASPVNRLLAGLSDNQRATLQNAILGALAGGAGTGTMGHLAGENGLTSAIPGALLGALAGGAGTAGYNYLTGSEKLKGERGLDSSLMQSITEGTIGNAVRNPGKAIGGGLGLGYYLSKRPGASDFEDVVKTMKRPGKRIIKELRQIESSPDLTQRLKDVWHNSTTAKGLGAGILQAVKDTANDLRISGTKVMRKSDLLRAKGLPRPSGRAALAAVPVGLGTGYLVDRYLKGDY